jgi:hypothetical protein
MTSCRTCNACRPDQPSPPPPHSAGRFVTNGGKDNIELLDALNDTRFLFHSAFPLLAITGLDLGQRLGVGWASNGLLQAGVTLSCILVIALSAVRNTLLLQTK